MVEIPLGSYVDVEVNTDNAKLPFKNWKDGSAPIPRGVSTLAGDAYHTYIMSEVATGRETEDVR
jgi:hypothetical protein